MSLIQKLTNRRPVVLILATLAIALGAYLLIGLVRLYIAPFILRTIWHVYLMRESIPQVMIWAIFVAAIPVLAAFVLIGERGAEVDKSGLVLQKIGGRVTELRRMVERAERGSYFQRQLERHMASLAVEMVQQREHLPAGEARARLRSGDVTLHPQAQAYLERAWERRTGDVEPRQGLVERLTALFRPRADSARKVDPQLLATITFLENELEVNSER